MAAPWWRSWFGGGGAKAVSEKTSQKKVSQLVGLAELNSICSAPYNQYTNLLVLVLRTVTVRAREGSLEQL